MAWNGDWPLGNLSVKNNRAIGNDNMSYIQTTMGNSIIGTNTNITRDHFWNVGANEDGRHRFINSPAFTVGGNPTDPVVGDGMDAVLYLKTTNSVPQWFTRTYSGVIYQATPNFLSGTVALSSSYVNLALVSANVYGEIIMWRTTQGKNTAQTGFFRSDAASVEAWALYLAPEGSSETINLKFANGADKSGLNIRVRAESGAAGTWNYRVTYRAI